MSIREQNIFRNVISKPISLAGIKFNSEFQKIILPLRAMQIIILSFKFKICNNEIAPNSIAMNCISIAFTILLISGNVYNYTTNHYNSTSHWYSTVRNLSDSLHIVFYTLGSLINTFINIRRSDSHVMLIAKIYKVFEGCKIGGYMHITVIFWSLFTLIGMSYISIIIFLYCFIPNYSLMHVIFDAFLLNADITMVYTICLVKIIRYNLSSWLSKFINCATRCQDTDTDVAELKQSFELYLNTIEAYNLFKKIVQEMVRTDFFFHRIKIVVAQFHFRKKYVCTSNKYKCRNMT